MNKINAFLVNINILKSIKQFKFNKPLEELHENEKNRGLEFGIYSSTYNEDKLNVNIIHNFISIRLINLYKLI